MSRYASQWIRCFDGDLMGQTAKRLSEKPGHKTNVDSGCEYCNAGKPGAARKLPLPLPGLKERGEADLLRLIVIAHGFPQATKLVSTESSLSPLELAQFLQAFLTVDGKPRRIERISLHVCFAAGRMLTDEGKPMYKSMPPQSSFAWELASYCGQLTKTITARNVSVGIDANFKRMGSNYLKPKDAPPAAKVWHPLVKSGKDVEKFVFVPDATSHALEAGKKPPTVFAADLFPKELFV